MTGDIEGKLWGVAQALEVQAPEKTLNSYPSHAAWYEKGLNAPSMQNWTPT